MADEFVRVAQAVLVQHAELVQHDGIVHRAAQAQVALAHVLQVAHEAERARARDFLDVGAGGEIHLGTRLRGRDHRVVELHREAQLESVVRLEARDLVAFGHFHRAGDADEALGGVLLDNAGGLDEKHERTGGSVHDRQLGRGQLHVGVVDAQAGHGRHQVLDRLHLGAFAGQARAQGGLGDQLRAGGNLHHRLQVGAPEHDAGVHRRRTQRHVDLFAAVQPHARRADHVLEGALLGHRQESQVGGT